MPGRRARRWPSAGCRSRSSTGRPGCWPTRRRSWRARSRRWSPTRCAATSSATPPAPAPAASRGTPRREANLAVLDQVAEGAALRGCATRCARSETGAAAGLAAATLLNNAIQLVFVVLFTRLLGADGYGALAAIVSRLLDPDGRRPVDPGRRRARGDARATSGADGRLRATLQTWTRQLVLATVVLGVLGVRHPPAAGRPAGRPEHPWAVAGLPATGVAVVVAVACSAASLQGLRLYGPVGRVDHRRGGRADRLRAGPVGRGARRDRRLPRQPAGLRGGGAVARARAVAAARRRAGEREAARCAAAARPGRRQLDPDRRPAAAGGAAERRRDRRAPPVQRRQLRLLRRGGGRGQVGGLGRDRRRAAAAARGDAPRRRRAGPAPGAAARAGGPRRGRDARAADLRARPRTS